ncbi:MAG TPA: aminotransferase class IV, partial [Steroidobacteraceae bacterium]
MSSNADTPDGVLFNGLDASESTPEQGRRALMSLLTDRGLHYGDGLFETIACRNGEPRFLDEHLERLALGCERLAIELGSRGGLVEDVARLAAGKARALVKVLVTRGPATARGYAPRGDEHPARIVLRYGWPAEDPSSAEQGVTV